ncbi:Apoptosis antagonizing transcription factor [Plasmodiophora brassicae]
MTAVTVNGHHRAAWEGAAARKRGRTDVDPEDVDQFGSAQLDDAHDDDVASDKEQDLYRRWKAARKAAGAAKTDDAIYDGAVVSRRELLEESDDGDDDDDDELVSHVVDDDDDDDVDSSADEQNELDSAPASAALDELEALEEDDNAFLFRQSQSSEVDVNKAAAVRRQRRLYDACLDVRIALQRPMQIVSRLPHGEDEVDALCQTRPDIQQALSSARSGLRSSLKLALDLERRLLSGTSTFPVAVDEIECGPDHTLDGIWSRIDARFESLRTFRDDQIDVWTRRTQIASGGRSLTNKKFKALNQSVRDQLRTAMANVGPHIERASAVPDSDPGTLCTGQRPDRYDDADLYRLLLKDLVSGADDVGALSTSRRNRSGARPAGKVVDRRASKGRKIRYVVHDKIVNFMAPSGHVPGVDFDIDQLFTHLFAS